jgi:hypothetical protein
MGQRFLAITYSPANGFSFSLQDTAHNGYHLTADLRTTLSQTFKLDCYVCSSVIVPWPNPAVAHRVVEHLARAAGLQAAVGTQALDEWLERVEVAATTPS